MRFTPKTESKKFHRVCATRLFIFHSQSLDFYLIFDFRTLLLHLLHLLHLHSPFASHLLPLLLADAEASARRRDEVARTAREHASVLDGVDLVLQQVLGVFEATQFESTQHARYECVGGCG